MDRVEKARPKKQFSSLVDGEHAKLPLLGSSWDPMFMECPFCALDAIFWVVKIHSFAANVGSRSDL